MKNVLFLDIHLALNVYVVGLPAGSDLEGRIGGKKVGAQGTTAIPQ
jgi:hypothetical protein